jgi:spore maturation protein CgeB
LRFALFVHSILSDWNHGNAHFLRGVASELLQRGHEVAVWEPRDAWSLRNLVADRGPEALDAFARAYPGLGSTRYEPATLDLDAALHDVDVVLVHEWNDPALVARIGEHRARHEYRLFFHDTHHRAATDPEAMARFDLRHYDGVLAFGRVIRDLYLERGWARRAFTWHEAADIRVFRPHPQIEPEADLVWIGNWGDEERTRELHEFLLRPVKELGLKARVHGVRYPPEALDALADAGIEYRGFLPNHEVPEVFARHRVTVHVPRRPYVRALPGIPTIRPFEAMACGIPLVSAPWDDREGLFTADRDYLTARDGEEMKRRLDALLSDEGRASALAAHGRRTVLQRHTCAHRVDELLGLVAGLDAESAPMAVNA